MSKILISGASGNLGGLVIKHLLESQGIAAQDIIAASRDTSKLAAFAAKGVELRTVDFANPATLASAFQGVDRLLLISSDAIGARIEQHKAAIDAAKQASVGRIFYTSMLNADTSKVLFAPEHAATEANIKASCLAYTIFRNGWYMENLFMAVPPAVGNGQWYTSAGDGKTAYIAREDIARAIAAGLANPVADNVTYSLNGDASYTNGEIAALVSEVIDKPIEVINLTDEQLLNGLLAVGIAADVAPLLVSFDTGTRAGDLDIASNDAATLANIPLVSLKAFLTDNAAKLVG
ncbi:SDR family oxidoreductase [Allorhizobium terrae]|uniref:SDR family oxidoreductase n=1 Tax=Allorhizobium terrae TaxID=1848972 RepID=A0A4V3W970_9HYPH|nr:SDR family oxidoreductase [Allorhizobium terrae]THF53977.1 SDR family oxidoreductase [Allorhizobium terrae]